MKTDVKKTPLIAILLTSILACAFPMRGFTAPLGLTTSSPTLEVSFAFIDYFDFGPDGDLSTSGAEVVSAIDVFPSGFTELGFGVGFSLADPTSDFAGGFDVFDEAGFFLGGDLVAVGFDTDAFEFQFGDLSGSAASDFGDSVLMAINVASLGNNPFAGLVDGEFYEASITVSRVVSGTVPTPATLPLFLFASAGFGWIGRKRLTQS